MRLIRVLQRDRAALIAAIALVLNNAAAPSDAGVITQPAVHVFTRGSDDVSAWDERLGALRRQGALQLIRTQDDHDFPGDRHLRLTQNLGGIPVFGAQIVQRIDTNGRTLSVCGRLSSADSYDTSPSLSPSQALRAVERSLSADERIASAPELVFLPLDDRLVLAYTLWSRASNRHSLMRHFIDARSGDIVSYEDLRTATAVGIGKGVWSDSKKVSANREGSEYRAEDLLRPARITTYDMRYDRASFNNGASHGFIATDRDNVWTDGAVVDAHVYAGWTYDYFFARHGRRSLDDVNLPINSFIHFELGYLNAFWDPQRMSLNFGDGGYLRGDYFRPFSCALDVVAHELSHGVTDFTWSGVYLNESGALTEAFSDIFGTAVEFFRQQPGNGRNLADYWVGEDLADIFDPQRLAIRSLADPLSVGDPDHYSLRYRGQSDNGGVHINASIAAHAFYLLVEGGRNRTSGLTAAGLGAANRDKAERIFYRGFVNYLFPWAAFADARRATIRAAEELYGADSLEAHETASAWTAVGID